MSAPAFAPVKPNWDYWGLIDLRGDYVLDPIYQDIRAWREGFAVVEQRATRIDVGGAWHNHLDGAYGFVGPDGRRLTDCSFGHAHDFCGGLAGVCREKRWGFIDTRGALVIPHRFDDVHPFHDGTCIVRENGRVGVIDRGGRWVIRNDYAELSGFCHGLAIASLDGQRRFVIDRSLRKVVDCPPQWPRVEIFSEDLVLIGGPPRYAGGAPFGFMDLTGEIRSEPQFFPDEDSMHHVDRFHDGMLTVRDAEGRVGYVDVAGALAIPMIFDEGGDFHGGVAEVELDGRRFFIDRHGHEVEHTPPPRIEVADPPAPARPFDEVLAFSEGLAVARRGGRWGVIDAANRVIVDFTLGKRHLRMRGDRGMFFAGFEPRYSHGLIPVEDERDDTVHCGYMDRTGAIAIALQFRVVLPFVCPAQQLRGDDPP